jgi:peptidoglycan/LPS O-acetylase OafA/YrhL
VFKALSHMYYWAPLAVLSLVAASYPIGTTAGTLFAHWTLPGWGEELHVLVHVLAAATLIAAIMAARPLQRLLETRLSLFFGRISFSVYLLHFLILGTYGSYAFIHVTGQLGYRVGLVVAFLPILAITVAAAYLYAKYVDERAIAFSGWAFRRWFGQLDPDMAKQPRAALPPLLDRVFKFIPMITKWSRSNLRFGRS